MTSLLQQGGIAQQLLSAVQQQQQQGGMAQGGQAGYDGGYNGYAPAMQQPAQQQLGGLMPQQQQPQQQYLQQQPQQQPLTSAYMQQQPQQQPLASAYMQQPLQQQQQPAMQQPVQQQYGMAPQQPQMLPQQQPIMQVQPQMLPQQPIMQQQQPQMAALPQQQGLGMQGGPGVAPAMRQYPPDACNTLYIEGLPGAWAGWRCCCWRVQSIPGRRLDAPAHAPLLTCTSPALPWCSGRDAARAGPHLPCARGLPGALRGAALGGRGWGLGG